MAGATQFPLPGTLRWPTCAVHKHSHSVTAMLPFFVYFLKRKRAFHWSPSVDLSDPYIAAALSPASYS